MKTLFKSKIIVALIFMGVLFSCKENKDGYSDEVDTKTPTETPSSPADSLHGQGQNVGLGRAESTDDQENGGAGNTSSQNASQGNTSAGNAGQANTAPGDATPGTSGSGGSEGKGSGPGESPKDGATYSASSGSQKDSTASGKKTQQRSKSTK